MNEGFALLNCSVRIGHAPIFLSTADFDLAQRKWYLNSGYARGFGDRYLHRLVASRTGIQCKTIDHINGDRLDNRRENLRDAGHAGNARNQTRKSLGHTSRFKGVHWAPWAKMWRAEITADGKVQKLGYFKSEEDAQRAYAAAAERLHGAFAAPYVEAK